MSLTELSRRVLPEKQYAAMREFYHNTYRSWQNFVAGKRAADWRLKSKSSDFVFLMRLENGAKINLYGDSKFSEFIYKGDYELAERQFLHDFLLEGDVFVDVGANIGLYSVLVARIVGPSGHVYSFEPCKKTYRRLLENIALNEYANVSTYQQALSDSTGEQTMVTSLQGYDAWNSLALPNSGDKLGTETVSCIRWDEFALQNTLLGRVAVMKVDAEGWESHVLAGASDSLAREDAPVLLIEFVDAFEEGGASCAELYEQLERLGYRLFTYNARKKQLDHSPLKSEYGYLSNLIALKNYDLVARQLSRHARRATLTGILRF